MFGVFYLLIKKPMHILATLFISGYKISQQKTLSQKKQFEKVKNFARKRFLRQNDKNLFYFVIIQAEWDADDTDCQGKTQI